MYKSTDGGGSWNPANTGLPADTYVSDLAIAPSNPAMLYAVTGEYWVYKSTDGGGSWNPANNGLTNLSVQTLAIDPSNPATLYAGTSYSGVYKFTSATECLFNWAGKNYPSLFAPAGSPTVVFDFYIYRHYSATNANLGVSWADDYVYYMGPDGYLQDEGPLSDWLPNAGCPVPATPPIECLFNWAESGYPALFAPAGSPTEVSGVYTYRRYSATDAYLGVSSADNHVYYKGPDGATQDEGQLSNWLFVASCL